MNYTATAYAFICDDVYSRDDTQMNSVAHD